MSTRVTQVVRVEQIGQSTGGNARVTQAARVAVADLGTPLHGGNARITQAARVIIGTIALSTGPAVFTSLTPVLRGTRRIGTPLRRAA